MKRHLLLVVCVVSVLLVVSATLQAQGDVTFQVNMKIKMLEGTFLPGSGDIVRVAGSFNDWGNSTDTLADLDGDSLYTTTVTIDTGGIQYKFLKTLRGGSDWEGGDNKVYTVVPGPQTIPAVYFDNDSVYTPPVPANVTFQVNMKVKILEESFQPGAGDIVRVAGSFNNWGSSTDTLTDLDNDSIYTKTIQLLENQAIQYKYLKTPRGGLDWETMADNRVYTVPVGGGSVPLVYFDNDSVINTPISATILFTVDMNAYLQVGMFRPDLGDSVEVRGAFNGWAGTKLEENVFSPGVYELTVPYSGTSFDNIAFKYFLDVDSAAAIGRWPSYSGTVRDGICYEHPAEIGDGNRSFNVGTGGNISTPSYYYSSINPGGIIPAGDTVTVTLAVNMNPAKSYTIPFNPATDSLWLVFSDASYTWTLWQEGLQGSFGTPAGFSPTAVDGDSIYYFTFDLLGPTPYNMQYRYRYTQPGNVTVDYASGIGQSYNSVSRYVQPTSPNVFPRSYSAPVDVWDRALPHLAETPPFNIVTAAGDGAGTGLPLVYSLSQNFPNPFNPATKISFTLPEKVHVLLKVYNLLGQEVATVLNAEKGAGSYTVDFNAEKLGTGVYFYRLDAGSFSQVKKMVIIK